MTHKVALHDRVKQKGFKITQPRKVLLQFLEGNSDKLYTAQEIYELVEKDSLDFSTVYRNLETLANADILCRVYGPKGVCSYGIACQHDHHHHLICTSCGSTSVIPFCPMDLMDKSLWKGFVPAQHRFEIMGTCAKCLPTG